MSSAGPRLDSEEDIVEGVAASDLYLLNCPDDGRRGKPRMKIRDPLIPRTLISCRTPGISSLACLGMS